MSFRALKIVCALSLVISLGGCVTGETIGSAGCCYPNAITLDGNPVPGNGDVCEHWHETWCAQRTNYRHMTGTIDYWAMNTNRDYPPYETFCCDQWPRSQYQIGKKIDEHLFNHDWDDPFVRCCEPDCNGPQCRMKYCDPCPDRRRCYKVEECCEPVYCDPCNPCAPASAPRAIDGPR
jgi:hypothetical protein